ncbi:MAG: efflux RND transporter periplasmic adaptor subunit [Pirellulales bacterium]|nr:efflux RND transporter periplasmic adaptor subunit [Pirellulales bacterium]
MSFQKPAHECNDVERRPVSTNATLSPEMDEGGLRAPPDLKGWRKFWWWFDFLILVKLARLRFIAVLVAIGLVITQWDRLVQYYERWTRPAGAAGAASSDIEYFCPMHPTVIRDNPKDKCPICFMPLSKRKKGDAHTEALPAGVVNRVQLSPYRVVLAGANTWKVDYQPLVKEIEAVGYIEFNERGERTVSARVAGRIDELFVSETGKFVDAGEKLAAIYSPELLSAVQSLLISQRNRNEELLKSTRTKLELLGVDARQIDEILAHGRTDTHVSIYSPITGHVIKKKVREGQYVEEGQALYEIADLSSVWILAQIYEDDLAFLPLEQSHRHATEGSESDIPVIATTRGLPGEEFEGKLTFIYPHVDQDTRTVAVRFEVANPGHKLRPGMTATVTLRVPPQDVEALKIAQRDQSEANPLVRNDHVLAVPESAVIDTGSQTIVYRQASPGVFEGVKVVLGPKMSGPGDVVFYPVLHGLALGAEIVTSGSFLVDAETRLNPAAGSIYFGGSGTKSSTAATTVRPSTPEDPDAMVKAELAKLPESDRLLAEAQRYCPVLTNNLLGSMGVPVKLTIDGEPVFLCCAGCKAQALKNSKATLAQLKRRAAPATEVAPSATTGEADGGTDIAKADSEEAEIAAALAELSAEDQQLARQQRNCAVIPTSRLGSMGAPLKLQIQGRDVFVCCEGCTQRATDDPKRTLDTVDRLRKAQAPTAETTP